MGYSKLRTKIRIDGRVLGSVRPQRLRGVPMYFSVGELCGGYSELSIFRCTFFLCKIIFLAGRLCKLRQKERDTSARAFPHHLFQFSKGASAPQNTPSSMLFHPSEDAPSVISLWSSHPVFPRFLSLQCWRVPPHPLFNVELVGRSFSGKGR